MGCVEIEKDLLLRPEAKTSASKIFQSLKLAMGFFREMEILEHSWVERCKPGRKFSGMHVYELGKWQRALVWASLSGKQQGGFLLEALQKVCFLFMLIPRYWALSSCVVGFFPVFFAMRAYKHHLT